MNKAFKALVVDEIEENKYIRSIKQQDIARLPQGDVLIRVFYSSLNYKDALAARGHKGITRRYPHTPGVDAAGVVEESVSPAFAPGYEVIVTGYDLGMNTFGGFGQYIRVPAGWVVKKPDGITLKESMMYGTAGFTAALGVYELQRHDIFPESGRILVTGATGGVGSMAVALLSHLGYEVTASSGKPSKKDYLTDLGASEIISREEVHDTSSKPLLQRRWKGAIENVGGITLSTVIRSMDYWGTVACCGNVESDKLDINVYPFILRGVTLTGIDSAERPMEIRKQIWENLSGAWKVSNIERIIKEVRLEGLDNEIETILRGQQVGRVLVNLMD